LSGLGTSVYCPHCHQFTGLTPAPAETECGHCGVSVRTAALWKMTPSDVWWIGVCNNPECRQPVLVHGNGDRIYPSPLPSPTDKRIPTEIGNDLTEAKTCFAAAAFRATAVLARRAMQSTCIDKGAKKDKLVDQVVELEANGTITKDLKKWVDAVRWVGNDAAHPGGPKVGKGDAENILKLAEQFLHVIYVAPAIAQEQMGKRTK
jgi:hypothetical protein